MTDEPPTFGPEGEELERLKGTWWGLENYARPGRPEV
jgi:hypothetical protein